jgi:hypothetical protein
MKLTDEQLKEIGKQAQHETLRKDEKDAMKLQLLEFVKKNPIKSEQSTDAVTPPRSRWMAWAPFGMQRPIVTITSFSLAAVAIVIVMGGGIALAANTALPGGVLYPLKLHVNEKVLSWLATSNEEKAQLHITLAKRRLEEVEAVVTQGPLNEKAAAQAKASFNMQVSQAEDSIKAIGEDKAETSTSLNAGFESLLRAHVQIIGNLVAKDDGHNVAVAKNFQENVHDRIDSVVKATNEDQEKIFAYKSSNLYSYATSKRTDAQNKIAETSYFVAREKNTISQDAYGAALANIAAGGSLIAQGQQKMNQQDYRGAVRLFQRAINIAAETQIGVLTNEKVNINIESDDINSTEDGHTGIIDNAQAQIHDTHDNLIKGFIKGNTLKKIHGE